MTPHNRLRRDILKHLRTVYPAGFFWPVADKYNRGYSDIQGILNGRGVAIEVKAGKDKLKPLQRWFLDHVRKAGGLSIVARSVQDVQRMI